MDFLEDLLERREGRRGGRHNTNDHEDGRNLERSAPPDARSGRREYEENEADGRGRRYGAYREHDHDDDEWGHGDGYSPLARWREHLRQPMVRVGLAVVGILLLGGLILAWPWLVQGVAYVNQHGIQGVLESLQGTSNRVWKGSG